MRADHHEWTIVHLCRQQAKRFGNEPFLSFEHGANLSFSDLDIRSDQLALRLAGQGLAPGDNVLALLKNRAEFMVAMLAVQKLGAVFVPINTELKGAFLEHQLRNAAPKVVLCEAALCSAFAGIDSSAANQSLTVVVAGRCPANPPPALARAALITWDDLSASNEASPGVLTTPKASDVLITPKPSDVACIMYTSGTTGPAKGVLMPHAHCYVTALNKQERLGLDRSDTYYVCMPLFHGNGLLMQVMATWMAGGTAHVVERFSPSRWLDEARACGGTVTNALGVMPEFVFRQPERPDDADNPLRTVCAVPIAEEWGEAFATRFGIELVQLYGMTECGITTYSHPGDPLMPGCMGSPIDEFFEMAVLDAETDAPLADNEVGEIAVRPKVPFAFMAGYHDMPAKTVEAWRNLWFHTGDAGRRDAQGRYHFVDRIKDCIRRRGENISSFHIEQVLNDHPAIAECAVVGVHAAGAGGEEEVKACVVLADSATLEQRALLDFCAARMPRFAVPRYIEQLDGLPKTATGKLQKQALRDAGVTPATWDREAIGYVLPRS